MGRRVPACLMVQLLPAAHTRFAWLELELAVFPGPAKTPGGVGASTTNALSSRCSTSARMASPSSVVTSETNLGPLTRRMCSWLVPPHLADGLSNQIDAARGAEESE